MNLDVRTTLIGLMVVVLLVCEDVQAGQVGGSLQNSGCFASAVCDAVAQDQAQLLLRQFGSFPKVIPANGWFF